MSALRVTVLQPAARLGLKGSDAATFCAADHRAVSQRCSQRATGGLRLASRVRLGNTEFLRTGEGDAVIGAVRTLARTAGLRAHAVLRADCCLLLEGNELFDRLSRVCAFDFAQLAAQPDMAVMTLLAEISVTFALDGSQLRLWADPGFATYLTHTLQSLTSAPSHGVHA
jgi:hypothetical protein